MWHDKKACRAGQAGRAATKGGWACTRQHIGTPAHTHTTTQPDHHIHTHPLQWNEAEPQLALRLAAVNGGPLVPQVAHPAVAAGQAYGWAYKLAGSWMIHVSIRPSACQAAKIIKGLEIASSAAFLTVQAAASATPAQRSSSPCLSPHGACEHQDGNCRPEGHLGGGHPVGRVPLPAHHSMHSTLSLQIAEQGSADGAAVTASGSSRWRRQYQHWQ
jgi:hypothetical protein